MATNKVLIYSNIKSLFSKVSDLLVRRDIKSLQIIEANDDNIGKLELSQFDIVLSEPNKIFSLFSKFSLPSVKWVQSSWAGVNGLLYPDTNKKEIPTFVSNFQLTRLGGVFGPAMAEYCISAMVNIERFNFQYKSFQNERKWNPFATYRNLHSLTLGIMGMGEIGTEIARVASVGFNMKVIGIRKEKSIQTKYFDSQFSLDEIQNFLNQCDYIVNTLPHTPQTFHLLSGNILSHCKEGCIFINVGRGTIIDEMSLLNALEKKWIGGAVLDVFEKEPLPEESKLWSMPNVHITPHVAATSLPDDVAKVFVDNYELYYQGKTLNYIVDVNKGY